MNEEIKRALFDMDTLKALGVMVFTLFFPNSVSYRW